MNIINRFLIYVPFLIGDNNKPIEGGSINTTTGVTAFAFSYSYSPIAIFTTTSTTTFIPSMTSSKAAFITALLILTPAIKLLKK